MLTTKTSTPTVKWSERLKQCDFHALCIKSAVTVSITVGTLKFIWHEIEWLVKAVRAWMS